MPLNEMNVSSNGCAWGDELKFALAAPMQQISEGWGFESLRTRFENLEALAAIYQSKCHLLVLLLAHLSPDTYPSLRSDTSHPVL